jgi:hypothetical protein
MYCVYDFPRIICPEMFHFANYGGVFFAEFLNWA